MHCKDSQKLQFDPNFIEKVPYFTLTTCFWIVHILRFPLIMRFTCMSYRCINNEKIESHALYYKACFFF